MTDTLKLTPDHWLVCHDLAFAGMTKAWAADAPGTSLTQLRLRHGQVERVQLQDLVARVAELQGSGAAGTVRVVIDRMTDDWAAVLDALPDALPAEVDLRVHVWCESPIEIMQTLATPEDSFLDAWSAQRRCPAQLEFTGLPAAGAYTTQQYQQAVADWKARARQEWPREMAALYDLDATLLQVLHAVFAAASGAASGLAQAVRNFVFAAQPAPAIAPRHQLVPVSAQASPGQLQRSWLFANHSGSLKLSASPGAGQAIVHLLLNCTPAHAVPVQWLQVQWGDAQPDSRFGSPASPLQWLDPGDGTAYAQTSLALTPQFTQWLADHADAALAVTINPEP